MKKIRNINHVRIYKDKIVIVTNDLRAISFTVEKHEIQFVLKDLSEYEKNSKKV